jgi:hypothetical protein
VEQLVRDRIGGRLQPGGGADVLRQIPAGAESVGRLAQLADADPLVCHDLLARAEGSHTPEPCV